MQITINYYLGHNMFHILALIKVHGRNPTLGSNHEILEVIRIHIWIQKILNGIFTTTEPRARLSSREAPCQIIL